MDVYDDWDDWEEERTLRQRDLAEALAMSPRSTASLLQQMSVLTELGSRAGTHPDFLVSKRFL